MRQKFTLITLGVKDFQKALAFYEGLGWKKSQQSQEAYALFPLGGIVLGLYPLQELEKDTTLNYQQASFSGMTISYNATSEEEVDTGSRTARSNRCEACTESVLGRLQRLFQRFGRLCVRGSLQSFLGD